MKFAGILLLVCSGLQALAAASGSASSALHKRLVELAAKNKGIVPLDEELFDKITSNDREWSLTMELTALKGNVKCLPCREFRPQYEALAKAWSTVNPADRDQHFFASIDFQDAQDVFRRLQLTTAPALNFFPAARGPRRPANGKIERQNYDFHAVGFDAEALAAELSHMTPVPIPYEVPFNWSGFITTALIGISVLASLKFVLPIFASRWTWAVLVIVSSTIFTTGIMFVRIRGMPFIGVTREGTSWMAGGYQNQYGMEVQVMTGIYGVLAFAYIALIFLIPRVPSASKQRVAVYIWCFTILLLFSVLLSLFRLKNTTYPFRLFL